MPGISRIKLSYKNKGVNMKWLFIVIICVSSVLSSDECDSTSVKQDYCWDDKSRTGAAVFIVIGILASLIGVAKMGDLK